MTPSMPHRPRRGLMASMDTADKRRNLGPAAAALLLMMLIAYPLSSGPARAIYGASGSNRVNL